MKRRDRGYQEIAYSWLLDTILYTISLHMIAFYNSTKYINIFIVAAEIIDNKESIV